MVSFFDVMNRLLNAGSICNHVPYDKQKFPRQGGDVASINQMQNH